MHWGTQNHKNTVKWWKTGHWGEYLCLPEYPAWLNHSVNYLTSAL